MIRLTFGENLVKVRPYPGSSSVHPRPRPPPSPAAMFRSACGSRRRSEVVRALLILGLMALSVFHFLKLWGMYRSEPVSVFIKIPHWEDVQVPGVTICGQHLDWRNETTRAAQTSGEGGEETRDDETSGQNVTLAQLVWEAGQRLDQLLDSCSPGCRVEESISQPGGQSAAEIGTWQTWMTTMTGAVCHTLTPNISWGQLADLNYNLNPTQSPALEMQLVSPESASADWDHLVFLHRSRRATVENPGVKGLRADPHFKLRDATLLTLSVSAQVYQHEDLRREPCDSTPGYNYAKCSQMCNQKIMADMVNCSAPSMIENFPHLPGCPVPTILNMMRSQELAEKARTCRCLPACRLHHLSVETEAKKLPQGSTASLRIEMGTVAEEEVSESLSYPLANLVSDVGGFVSLLLGVSALSLVDLLGI